MLEPNRILQKRYRVIRQIARGGMGAVYEAEDQRLGHIVALKETLAETPELRAAFEREARLLARLNHPMLPDVTDHFVEGNGQFLVMRYVPGDDLAAMLHARGQPFEVDQVLAWGDDLLAVLDYLHSQEPPVVHRDIKPQNLKLTPDGELVLLDFGLAKGGQAGATRIGPAPSLPGYTPQYAPLEQIQASGTDPRSDLYALAATLYHLMTGVQPPDALTRASATLHHQPDLLIPAAQVAPWVPPAVSEVLSRAMALRAMDRPATADTLRTLLRAAAQGQAPAAPTLVRKPERRTASAPPTYPPRDPEAEPIRSRIPAWLLVPLFLLICLGVGGGAYLATQGRARVTPTITVPIVVAGTGTPELPAVETSTVTPEPPTVAPSVTSGEPVTLTEEPTPTGESATPEPASATPEPETPTATITALPTVTPQPSATPTVTPVPPTATTASTPATATPTPVPDALTAENIGEAMERHRFTLPDTGRDLAFAQSSALLLASSGDSGGFAAQGWESGSGAAWGTLDGHTGIVWAIATSPDDQWIATGSDDRKVRFWSQQQAGAPTLETIAREAVVSLVFSPTEPLVAAGTGGAGMNILLIPLPGGPEGATLGGHVAPGSVTALAFLPDGTRLLSSGTDRTIRLWDVAARRQLRSVTMHSAQITDVTVNRDGTLAASSGMDNRVRLFNPDTLAVSRTITLDGPAYGVAFNPNGDLLAVGIDGEVGVWQISNGELLARFVGQSGPVNRVTFSPDGTMLAAVGTDDSVWLWALP